MSVKRREALALATLGLLLPGCGGGSDGFASIGSGGTGISPGGIGSGGTGIVTRASSVGPVDGFGSIIVNGIRFDTDAAAVELRDVTALRLGVVVQVTGSFDPATGQGTATRVQSAAELRGSVESLDKARRRFQVRSLMVEIDDATVFAGGLAGSADLAETQPVQVHGLPGSGGELRATRVELLAVAGEPIVTGVVRDLDPATRSFRIADQLVRYTLASLDALTTALAAGQLVRVRGPVAAGRLDASSVEAWRAAADQEDGQPLSLGGLVSQFRGLSSLRVDGQMVDASQAKVSGGPASVLADGVRVDVTGVVRGGVLAASRIRLRGAARSSDEDMSFSIEGRIGDLRSPMRFLVKGQAVDASGATLVGGARLPALANGLKVRVTGLRVVDDVLLAERLEIL